MWRLAEIEMTCYASEIMPIVLLISQKDYELYEKRTDIVFAGHTVASFGNGGL